MSFVQLVETWTLKAKSAEVLRQVAIIRKDLHRLQRYWRIYEEMYSAWKVRDLTSLERELFSEESRAFEVRIRRVLNHEKKIDQELSRINFWRILKESRTEVLEVLEEDNTKSRVVEELRWAGFLPAEIEQFTKSLPISGDNISLVAGVDFNLVSSALNTLPVLMDEYRLELINEGLIPGLKREASPSSHGVLMRILGIVVGFFLVGSDLKIVTEIDPRSIAGGTFTVVSQVISMRRESKLDLLIRYIHNRDPRLKGELDLISQKMPQDTTKMLRYNRLTADENISSGVERFLRDYFLSGGLEDRKSLLEYLELMGISTESLRKLAREEADKAQKFVNALYSH